MLNDREQRQWAAISRELTATPPFSSWGAAPSRHQRLRQLVARTYPASYLSAMLVYTLLATGGEQFALICGAFVSAVSAWLAIELLALKPGA